MEDILLDTMFELPGADGVEEVVVNDAYRIQSFSRLSVFRITCSRRGR
jgi:ATP-dependent protease Clp ATPase subunit